MRVAARRLEHERVLTGTLAVTVTVSYGVLLYAFPIVLAPMEADTGWSRALLTGGYSAAALAAGAAAIPVGRWIDRHGPRVVMTAGSTLAVVLLLAWSRVQDPVAYLLVWIGLGACLAAVCYEPAFAAIAQRCDAHRARAFAAITLAGGLASTLFVPFVSALLEAHGWRGAVARLALTLGAATIAPHALLLRSHRTAIDPRGAPAPAPGCSAAQRASRTGAFGWISAALLLATLVNFAVAVHLVPILLERGFTPSVAVTALALLGLAKLPGRLLVVPLAARASAGAAVACVLALQVVALLVFSATRGPLGLWLFIALFGAGDGACTPARAELLAEVFGASGYGRASGLLAFILSLGRAAGPLAASLAWTLLGGYDAVLWILLAVAGGAALIMSRVQSAGGLRPSGTSPVYTPDDVSLSTNRRTSCLRLQ